MYIGLPQAIWLVLSVIGIGIAIAQDGELVKRNATAVVIAAVLEIVLLWWGGFFIGG